MDARNLLSLSGVLTVLGGVLYYWGMGHSAPQISDNTAQLPDYEVEKVQSWQTNEQGQMQRYMQADGAVHFKGGEDRTEVRQPLLVLFRDGQPSWRLSARQAIGTDQNHEVLLDEQVHAERVAAGAVPIKVDMASLNVHLPAQTMDTEVPVRVDAGELGQIQSQGLRADLRADTLNLSHEVRAVYVTHP